MERHYIRFGLVTIPVKLHAATEDKGIKLRQIHDKCKKPIKQEKVCPICNEDVDSKSLVKGYEYASDRFVVITDAELSGLKSDSRRKSSRNCGVREIKRNRSSLL